MKQEHIGSSFDDFLNEEGIFSEVEEIAIKKVFALKVKAEMRKNKITQEEMAKRMNTKRPTVVRALNPENTSITLKTMEKIARALGKKLEISLG
jgi:antitoxin HicB